MPAIFPHFYQMRLGIVNAYLLDHGMLTLIDAGYPGSSTAIFQYIERELKRSPQEIENIIITHAHPDHVGGLGEIQQQVRARVIMHPDDAEMVSAGMALRSELKPSPGVLNQFIYRQFIQKLEPEIIPVQTDLYVADGDYLDIGKGFTVVHTPGHCAGQVALLYHDFGGLLIAADTCVNIFGLRWPPAMENFNQGKIDLQKLAAYNFEAAVFGHGKPLKKKACKKFRKRFA